MRYLLDANTYIQAKNQYYGMDICPAYWDWLDLQFEQGLIGSVDMIGRELRDGNDELADWVRERPGHFISNDDEDVEELWAEGGHPSNYGDFFHPFERVFAGQEQQQQQQQQLDDGRPGGKEQESWGITGEVDHGEHAGNDSEMEREGHEIHKVEGRRERGKQ